jgi:DNA-directed RNA polymerase specialized sigma24 family protein
MDFPPTVWTLISQAQLKDDAAARGALEHFCLKYRGPVIAFFRMQRVPESEVEDLAHDFLLKFMKSDFAAKVDPGRGKFRSYLLGALHNYWNSVLRERFSLRRGGGVEPLSLDASGVANVAEEATEEEIRQHDREWAVNLLLQSYQLLEEDMVNKGHAARLVYLRPFLLPGGGPIPSHSILAGQLGCSEVAARSEVSRLRKRFAALFRGQVERTVSGPHEVDEEVAYLQRALRAGT